MTNFKMDDYVDVAERIREFYERYPDGRLTSGSSPQVFDVGGKPFIAYHARAWRTADDPVPGDGWAWEPVPGPTQFTRDSELMNAETAAWGRAIVSLGFQTKKIASAQEVRARGADVRSEERTAVGATAAAPAATNGHGAGSVVLKYGPHAGKTIADLDRAYIDDYLASEKGSAFLKDKMREFIAAAPPDDMSDIPF